MHFGLNASIDDVNTKETRDILLPSPQDEVNHIALDIGGTLCKLVYYTKNTQTGGRLNFHKFETHRIVECIAFIHSLHMEKRVTLITATGGGAHKFHDLIRSELGVAVLKEDEMHCLIIGLNFLVKQIPNEVFTYDERRAEPMLYETRKNNNDLFPYMIVNIGSGVSILKITDENHYERISGTSLGGGTLCGLLSLLTDASSYDEMLDYSRTGDNKKVDLSVGDIYGGDYSKVGLKATTIASSFGGIFKQSPEDRKRIKKEDICSSLLFLVSNNIGQIAYLNAKLHNIDRIYFSGFFIRGHPITMNTLTYSINFWSKGKIQAHFLRHEGYLGAVGAFLSHAPNNDALKSFIIEDFSHAERITQTSVTSIGTVQMSSQLLPFPSLVEESYKPDTLSLHDSASQQYWLNLFSGENIDFYTNLCKEYPGNPEIFRSMFLGHLEKLRLEPYRYGPLTVHSLLILREQCLRESGFTDIFKHIKAQENDASIDCLQALFQLFDAMSERTLVETLLDNVLAGNMNDWGSSSVVELIKNGQLDFEGMKRKVTHPLKFNNSKQFVERLVAEQAYEKIVIFVDNSGADIVLGILPFVRYLASKGSTVILAANSAPSLNDITAKELQHVMEKVSLLDTTLADGWKSGKIIVMPSGSSSPCVDLSRIDHNLAKECADCDLIVIEGMGRAIHTNLFARFKVDSLKIAVFKNQFTAEKLNAELYDAICLFQQADEL